MYIISVGSPFECCVLESYLLTLRVKLFEHHGKAAVYFIVVRQVGFFLFLFFVVVVVSFLHFTIMIAFFIGFLSS